MRAFIIALQFLTCIPLAPGMKVNEEEVGRSMRYFPLVGLCMGACLAYTAYFRRTLGGVTGDVLGAATELAETAALIMLLVKF